MTHAIRETLRQAPTPELRGLLTRPVKRFLAGNYVDRDGRRCLVGWLEGWGFSGPYRFRASSLSAPGDTTRDWDALFTADPAAAVRALRAEVRAVLAERGATP